MRNGILFAMACGVWAVASILGQINGTLKAISKPKETQAMTTQQETFDAVVSAYCPCEKCCPGTSDNITANGHRIKPGEKFVAADRRYAFGTMMTIPGYNEGRPVPVLDRGGAINGNKIDLYFDTHKAALEWGVKTLQVRIVR